MFPVFGSVGLGIRVWGPLVPSQFSELSSITHSTTTAAFALRHRSRFGVTSIG